MNFTELEKKYRTEAAFNKITNLLRQAIEEFGFLPSELREALFLAQYMYEMNNPQQVIRTQEDWNKISAARELMKMHFSTYDKEVK